MDSKIKDGIEIAERAIPLIVSLVGAVSAVLASIKNDEPADDEELKKLALLTDVARKIMQETK